MNKIYLLCFTIFLLATGIIYGQKAHCKRNLTLLSSYLDCHAKIDASTIDSSSTDFDYLEVSEFYLSIGHYNVTLYTVKNEIRQDSCMTSIQVYPYSLPTICKFIPDTLRLNTSFPYKLQPSDVKAERYLHHCLQQTITIHPTQIYCNDPPLKLVIIRYTDQNNEYYEVWNEIYIMRQSDDPCLDPQDKEKDLTMNNQAASIEYLATEASILLKTEYYDTIGRIVTEHTDHRIPKAGIYIVKKYFAAGSTRSKVVYLH